MLIQQRPTTQRGYVWIRVIRNGSFTSARQVRDAIDRFTGAYNEDCAPFEWTKEKVRQVPLKKRYMN